MTHNDRSGPSVTQRVADAVWRRKAPLTAVWLGVLATGVVVVLASMQASQADVATAGVVAPVTATDLPTSVAAQEEGTELHCPGVLLPRFDPGVSATPQPQTVTGQMLAGTGMDPRMPCTSPTGAPYLGGEFVLTASGVVGCASYGVVMDLAGTADIFWDNGDVSKAEWSAISYGATPIVEYRIVEGALAPAYVLHEGTLTGMSGNCATQPMTRASYTGVVEVIGGEGAEVPEAGRALQE